MADIVAKVPKGGGANFPPNNKTSNNRRSIGLQTRYQTRLCVLRLATRSPASLFNRCTYGSENLSPTSQKDFCNKIGTERTWRSSRCMSVIGATADDICSPRVFRLLTHLRHWYRNSKTSANRCLEAPHQSTTRWKSIAENFPAGVCGARANPTRLFASDRSPRTAPSARRSALRRNRRVKSARV